MDKSNFEFFKEIDSYLYSLCVDAEQHLYKDNDTAMYKIRKIAEIITKDIARKNKVNEIINVNQYVRNTELYKGEYISKFIYEHLEEIRNDGNNFVHAEGNLKNADTKHILKVLKSLYIVSAYYVREYINEEVQINHFASIYIDTSKVYLVNKELENLSDEEREFHSKIMELLNYRCCKCIVDKKLFGFGSVLEAGYISYEEFYDYYIEVLNALVLEDSRNIDIIMYFKEINKKIIKTFDGCDINNYIARALYNMMYKKDNK